MRDSETKSESGLVNFRLYDSESKNVVFFVCLMYIYAYFLFFGQFSKRLVLKW